MTAQQQYFPVPAPSGFGDDSRFQQVTQWADQEFKTIAERFNSHSVVQHNVLNGEPPKPREGTTAVADGTNWNPGNGAGLYLYQNGAWVKVSGTREVLTAARTYYVRTDGSDSNDGLTDSAGGAFLTIQHAIDVLYTLDFNSQPVVVQVKNGTFTAGGAANGVFVGGIPQIQGDTTTPSNVVISTTSAHCFAVGFDATLQIAGFKLQTTTSGSCLLAQYGGKIVVNGNMEYGACANFHAVTIYQGLIELGFTNYTISGGAQCHMLADSFGEINNLGSKTVTVSGTPAFSLAFAFTDRIGQIVGALVTYSGAATGKRYQADRNSGIDTAGGGANYFPGNAAGTTATGGYYS